jgi:hypothetical protein
MDDAMEIKCPDCKGYTPEDAMDCIHCGRRIESSLADFRMRFETLIEDIRYTKEREWTITNYLLLLYSGLIALGLNIPCKSYGLEILLGAFGLFTLIFGFKYLNELSESIKVYRTYLYKDILPKLTINEIERRTVINRSKDKKKTIVQDDEKVIEDHKKGKDSKTRYLKIMIVSAFVFQLLLLKDFIPFIRYIFSWAFNC